MRKAYVLYKDGLMEDLQDPEEAAAYLNAALEEGSREAFLMALRDVAEARGMSRVAATARLNRVSMYRMLSKRGNPQLSSLTSLLEEMGLTLAVEVKKRTPTRRAAAGAKGKRTANSL
jgi:probable addiction module antidote protein